MSITNLSIRLIFRFTLIEKLKLSKSIVSIFWRGLPFLYISITFIFYYFTSYQVLLDKYSFIRVNNIGYKIYDSDPYFYFYKNVLFGIALLLPIQIIFWTMYSYYIENKNGMLLFNYTLPFSITRLFWGKLSFIILALFKNVVYTFIFSILLINVLKVLRPDLAFDNYKTGYLIFLIVYLKVFISSIAIIAIQLLLAFIFENYLVPLCTGGILLFLSLLSIKTSLPYNDQVHTVSKFSALRNQYIALKLDFSQKNIALIGNEELNSLVVAAIICTFFYFFISGKLFKT